MYRSPGFLFAPGTRADYLALARFHYRAGPPVKSSRYFTLRTDDQSRSLVGVLVVSPPVLNGTWRRAAWPHWPALHTTDRREAARALNANLRVISRVIIDPRYRGLGLASQLVREYLANPLTPRTEALAAMGTLHPFFDHAGMRRVPIPTSRRDARLAHVLASLNLEPWMLVAPWALPPRLRRSQRLARAIRRWALDSAATRRLARTAPLHQLMVNAAVLSAPRSAWVHVVNEGREAREESPGDSRTSVSVPAWAPLPASCLSIAP